MAAVTEPHAQLGYPFMYTNATTLHLPSARLKGLRMSNPARGSITRPDYHVEFEPEDPDASTARGQPLPEFHQFSRLPAELRVEIWKHTFPGRRYIEMRSSRQQRRRYTQHASAAEKAPVAYYICHESRAEVLQRYTRFPSSSEGAPVVLVDFTRDVICFRTYNYTHELSVALRSMPTPGLLEQNLRYLLIDSDYFDSFDSFIDYGIRNTKQLTSLREIMLAECRPPEERRLPIAGFEEFDEGGGKDEREMGRLKPLFSPAAWRIEYMAADDPAWTKPTLRFGKIIVDTRGYREKRIYHNRREEKSSAMVRVWRGLTRLVGLSS